MRSYADSCKFWWSELVSRYICFLYILFFSFLCLFLIVQKINSTINHCFFVPGCAARPSLFCLYEKLLIIKHSMVRRSHHAFHDLGAESAAANANPVDDTSPTDSAYVDLPEMEQINQRLAGMRATSVPEPTRSYNTGAPASHHSQNVHNSERGKHLIDKIPSPALPSTLSIGGQSREPVPEVPAERELAQFAIDGTNKGIFRTFEDACPPPADTLYSVADQGMSGPNCFRVSMYNVPASAKLRESSQLPLALLVRPFAETNVPLADFSMFKGAEMPPRCVRCRAYMNASVRFIEGGIKFVCNMCLFVNHTPSEYYQPLTADGKRVDWAERPELAYGTYEFEVAPPINKAPETEEGDNEAEGKGVGSSSYGFGVPYPGAQYGTTAADPKPGDQPANIYGESSPPMKRVFCCECTRDAVQKGALATFVNSVREALTHMLPGEQVAIMLFSDNIHYFRKLGNTQRVQMLVVNPDENAAVVPPDVFYTPDSADDSQALNNLLEAIPTIFATANTHHNCYGSAVTSALGAVQPGGGRISTILCSLPSVKPGKLTTRDLAIPGITPNDSPVHHQLFAQTDKFYLNLASRARDAGVGIDVLAMPTVGSLDIAVIATLPQQSGGRLFYHPRFSFDRDNTRVVDDFLSLVQPAQARSASLRVRCSTGLQVKLLNEYASHSPKDTDTRQGYMDENTTVVAELRHDAILDPKLDAHFQTAILYTAPDGSKRVRVLNLLAGVATKMKALLKFVDVDVVLAVLVRQTLAQLDHHESPELRDAVKAKILDIFGAARLHAGQGMPLSQLLMPTNLRELIMMGLALTKSIPLGSRPYSVDARVANAVWMTQATPEQLALSLYPRIHDIVGYADFLDKLNDADKEAHKNTNEQSETIASIAESIGSLPRGLRARGTDLLLGSQAHLIYDGQQFFLWLGAGVNGDVLEELFGVRFLNELNPYIDSFPVLDTKINDATRQLCTALALRTGRAWHQLQIVREKLDGAEYQVRQMMVEDAYGDAPQYSNFVLKVHEHAKSYKEHHGWF